MAVERLYAIQTIRLNTLYWRIINCHKIGNTQTKEYVFSLKNTRLELHYSHGTCRSPHLLEKTRCQVHLRLQRTRRVAFEMDTLRSGFVCCRNSTAALASNQLVAWCTKLGFFCASSPRHTACAALLHLNSQAESAGTFILWFILQHCTAWCTTHFIFSHCSSKLDRFLFRSCPSAGSLALLLW